MVHCSCRSQSSRPEGGGRDLPGLEIREERALDDARALLPRRSCGVPASRSCFRIRCHADPRRRQAGPRESTHAVSTPPLVSTPTTRLRHNFQADYLGGASVARWSQPIGAGPAPESPCPEPARSHKGEASPEDAILLFLPNRPVDVLVRTPGTLWYFDYS